MSILALTMFWHGHVYNYWENFLYFFDLPCVVLYHPSRFWFRGLDQSEKIVTPRAPMNRSMMRFIVNDEINRTYKNIFL